MGRVIVYRRKNDFIRLSKVCMYVIGWCGFYVWVVGDEGEIYI